MNQRPRPKELDSPMVKKIMRVMSLSHVWLYRKTDGKLGGKFRLGSAFPRGLPVLLLTTKGRRTGIERTAPLLFIEDGDRVALVASQGGLPKHPLWYENLSANPDVTVQIGSAVRHLRARTATPEERAALWPRLVAHYRDFADYQSWTERTIPVVILEPAA